ncbi:response regulator transcription factor [Variovorax sp. DAIF25]|uniref:helix-turn-helix transcriptional regulator n=1 Tax=Variovorax sp. DAIF25 TaxID=3080983 RepID=UPI003D6C4D89
MSQDNAASIAEFLLKLYSSAQGKSVALFPEFAIEELKRFVDFDMALFGLIRPAPAIPAGVHCSWTHIHREPTNMVEEWLTLCSEDHVLQNMKKELGRVRSYHVPTVFSKREDAKILDFALRTRHINLAAVANSYGANGLCGAFSIRRADTTWKFSDGENSLVQLLSPHIWEAIRINRTIMAGKVQGLGSEPVRGLCVSDDKGTIVFQDNSFERLRQIMFRDSSTYRLPEILAKSLLHEKKQILEDGRMLFTCKSVANLRFITATLTSSLHKLSIREKEIAKFFGTGLTHAEIADELRISGSTVRRHIEAVYKKLEIRNKSDLSFLIHTSQDRCVEHVLSALEAAVI